MIQVKPLVNLPCTCPDCGCKNPEVKRFFFQGMHSMVESECGCCEAYYYHTLPIFYDESFSIGISKKTEKVRYALKADTLAKPLILSLRAQEKYTPQVLKIIYKEYKEVIILNCLDIDYNNIVSKILNAWHYLKMNSVQGLIMIIPSCMMWMVPEGIAEVWIIEARIFRLNKYIYSLDEFYQKEEARFEKIYLGKTIIHPDLKNIPLELFLKKNKFDFSQAGVKPFQITFFLSEDRFWLTNKADQFLFQLATRFNLMRYLKSYFCFKQNRNCSVFADKISKVIKNISITATGTGKTGKLGKNVLDERRLLSKEDPMQYWTGIYSESDLSIGLHGDDMIIPKALAGNFIEIYDSNKEDFINTDKLDSVLSEQMYLPGINLLVNKAIHLMIE